MADRTKFVKVYTDLPDHPEWMELDPAHVGLWVLALMYCRRNLTDGHFPAKAVRRWGGEDATVDDLVDAGRLHRPGHACETCPEVPEGGLYLHDFLDHQMSKADAERLSSKRAEAGRRGGQRKAADLQRKQVAKQTPGNDVADPDTDPDTENNTTARQRAAGKPAESPDEFATWWETYPRKVGKRAAQAAYGRARRHADAATLLAALEQSLATWRSEGRTMQLLPHPTTWLNQGRWEDETPPAEAPSLADRQASVQALPEPPEDVAGDPAKFLAWAREQRTAQRAAG